VGQVVVPLWQADTIVCCCCRLHNTQRVGIGHTHVFAGQDEETAQYEARILPGVDHLRQPVQSRVGIRAAHRLDERADRVKVIVALAVVQHGARLDGLLRYSHVDHDAAVRVGRRRGNGQLQGIQQCTGVPVGDVHQVIQRLRGHLHVQSAVAALGIRQGVASHLPQMLLAERHELKDAAPAEEGAVH